MKKLKMLLILLSLLPKMAFSQGASGQGGLMGMDKNFISPENGMANIGGTSIPMDRDLYEGVKGSPMVCKEFVKGFIVTKDTFNKLDKFTYNFDVFKNELHIRYPDGKVKIPFNNQIRGFQLIENDIAHNFKKANVPNDNGSKFYEIIAETQQYSLLKLWIKKFSRANASDNGITQTGRRYDEFENDETYFFKVTDGVYKEIKKLTKTNFIELLPNRKTDIEAYWKTNKLGKKMTELEARGFLKALEIAKN
jgi:hypothetical protein